MSLVRQADSVRNLTRSNLEAALARRTMEKGHYRWSKNIFIGITGMNPTAIDKAQFLESIPARFVAAFSNDTTCPPNEYIKVLDTNFIRQDPLHDSCDNRRPIVKLDEPKHRLDVATSDSICDLQKPKENLNHIPWY
jgi:hypothetical protein